MVTPEPISMIIMILSEYDCMYLNLNITFERPLKPINIDRWIPMQYKTFGATFDEIGQAVDDE